jgi:uncharacterized membrane protein
MNQIVLRASMLTAAIGLAMAMHSAVANDAKGVMTPELKDKIAKLEKCYGVNAASKNDCANGAHSCAGETTAARDPKSFILLPAGDCAKIAGGQKTPS